MQSMIRVDNLSVNLKTFQLESISIDVEENDFFVIIGPTGAGKTVLVEAIAGLTRPDTGHIFIRGRDVTSLPPEKRGVGIVYQDCSLFPHMSVRRNIIYGLQRGKIGREKIAKRLEHIMELLEISHLSDRDPGTLSGGECQRVALARALIVEPDVLLLDEPMSALDPPFREEMRKVLRRIHASSGTTFVMVTHDFTEALFLGQNAAVLNRGKLEQAGDISEIFHKPESPFVARFTGMKNIFKAAFSGTQASIDGIRIELGKEPGADTRFLAVRPEDMVLSSSPVKSSMRNCFQATVTNVMEQGFHCETHVRAGNTTFKALVTRKSLVELGLKEGAEVFVSFKATAVHCF